MTATKGFCKMIYLKIRYNITNKTWAFGQYAGLRTGWSDLGRNMALSCASGHIPSSV